MTVEPGCSPSIALGRLVDGPRQSLRVVHRCGGAWQLADGSGRVVACVTTPGGVRLPHAVVVPSLPGRSASVAVGGGAWSVADVTLRVVRWWAPERPRLPGLLGRINDPSARALAAGWRSRLGRGAGLTPYDDDVLCGALVTLVAAGHRLGVELALEVGAADLEASTTATSAALLRQAAAGRCIDALAAHLRARDSRPELLAPSTAALEAVGHSSGRGLAEGVRRMLGPVRSVIAGAPA